MQKHADVVLDPRGNVVSGASVRVLMPDGALANIYSVNGDTQASNPLTSGALGEFSFYAPNGAYKIEISVGTKVIASVGPVTLFDVQDDTDLARLSSLGAEGGAGKVGFKQDADGAVARTAESKLRDTISPKEFGAVGDGVAIDTVAIQRVKAAVEARPSAVVNFSGGRHKTSGTFWPNNVSPTLMYFDKASVLGLFDGTSTNPNATDNDPALFVQKYTSYDTGTDSYAHNVGGVFGSVIVKGSGSTTNDIDGTWIGVLGNAVMDGKNQGTDEAPDYDAAGNVIGMAGFARLNGPPGDGKIACGVWGYPEGPTLTQAQLDALPADNWSLCAIEGNIQQNHPDIGERDTLSGKGSTVGIFLNNYRTPNTGMCNWSFGIVIQGNRVNPAGSSTDPDNFNGIYTGILLNNIKAKGIRFGTNFKNGSYGLWFPDAYPGERPVAAMYVGNNVVNWAQYTGATWNDGDMWANAGVLYYRKGGTNREVMLNGERAITQSTTGVGINTSAPGFHLDVTAENNGSNIACTGYGPFGGNLLLRGAAGTKTAPTAVTNDFALGFIGGRGHNGTSISGGSNAGIGLYAAENWTDTANGTYIAFGTTPLGTTGRVEALRIDAGGNVQVRRVGAGLRVKEGANAKQGVATLAGGTVTVANASVTANSRIFLTAQDNNSTGALRASARTAGTSFTITSSNGADSGVVAYEIFDPA